MRSAAFLSYARLDDDDHRLSDLGKKLCSEVRKQTGEAFDLFQDRTSIPWGENWPKRIVESIHEATFFIPILTPSYFKSQACRDEAEQFLLHERGLRRDDLVLPIYYIDCGLRANDPLYTRDQLAREICHHQYVDWRGLRFRQPNSQGVCTAIEVLARNIRDAMVCVGCP